MDQHCKDVIEYHTMEANYAGDSGELWERFYDSFDRFEMEGH